jgi:cyclopropane fatty-acyl-phospholipid synthase-like methyltransferase
MNDLFEQKAGDWDARPVPAQISTGVGRILLERVELREDMTVMDFGAGTGLVCAHVAPHVGRVFAVDVSAAMLEQLVAKPELQGKVQAIQLDILDTPLSDKVDLIVSAMAMHHVEDTDRLLAAFATHLAPGGKVALADLDSEDGTFHPPDTEGVYHHGFDRDALREKLAAHGFADIEFATAVEVNRDGTRYPVFFVTATLGGLDT